MQRIKASLSTLLVCFLTTLISCDQIEKSIRDTQKPVPENFGSDSSTNSNHSPPATTFTADQKTATTLINEYFEQHKSSTTAIEDSALMHLIEVQLKSSGSELDNKAVLDLIRKQLKQLHPSENHVRNTQNNYVESAEKLAAIKANLQNLPQFKGKEIMMYRGIYMYQSLGDWIINISIQDPDKHENIDGYTYRDGKWQDPRPEQSPTRNELSEYLSPLNNFKFPVAHKVFTLATEKAKAIEGAKPVDNIHYYYRKGTGAQWKVYIDGTRNRFTLSFDREGNFIKMDKR